MRPRSPAGATEAFRRRPRSPLRPQTAGATQAVPAAARRRRRRRPGHPRDRHAAGTPGGTAGAPMPGPDRSHASRQKSKTGLLIGARPSSSSPWSSAWCCSPRAATTAASDNGVEPGPERPGRPRRPPDEDPSASDLFDDMADDADDAATAATAATTCFGTDDEPPRSADGHDRRRQRTRRRSSTTSTTSCTGSGGAGRLLPVHHRRAPAGRGLRPASSRSTPSWPEPRRHPARAGRRRHASARPADRRPAVPG